MIPKEVSRTTVGQEKHKTNGKYSGILEGTEVERNCKRSKVLQKYVSTDKSKTFGTTTDSLKRKLLRLTERNQVIWNRVFTWRARR